MSKDIVAYIRHQTEWCSRSLSGGDWFAIDPDDAPFKAADRIEQLEAEVSRVRTLVNLEEVRRKNAEAQDSRMRDALKEIATVIGPFESQGDILKYANMLADIEQIAVKALEQ